jgi:hypothetical protein
LVPIIHLEKWNDEEALLSMEDDDSPRLQIHDEKNRRLKKTMTSLRKFTDLYF